VVYSPTFGNDVTFTGFDTWFTPRRFAQFTLTSQKVKEREEKGEGEEMKGEGEEGKGEGEEGQGEGEDGKGEGEEGKC